MVASVLITGASSGIGLETAVHLAKKGFRVFATMRDPSRRELLDQAAARAAVTFDVVQLDVLDPTSIHDAVRTVVDSSGNIDAVVCNAGIQLRGYFEDTADQETRLVYETNVFGTMNLVREAIPYMRRAGKGRVVLVSSVGGRIGAVALSSYCSSKFALEGFGECLSLELAPFNVRVSIIEPGIIKTDVWGRNRMIAKAAKDPSSPYFESFAAAERLADWAVETSPTKPSDVSIAVYKALTASRPKLRYLVGQRAAVLLTFRRLLPAGVFDRLYASFITSRVTKASNTKPVRPG